DRAREPDPPADQGSPRLRRGPVERSGRACRRDGKARQGELTMKERPILICYDGSEDARRAVAAAGGLLRQPATVGRAGAPPLTAEEAEAALCRPVIPDNVESRVRDLRRMARRGTLQARAKGLDAVDRVVVAAPTWQGVVEVADEIDAAVIVVGSRGLSGA